MTDDTAIRVPATEQAAEPAAEQAAVQQALDAHLERWRALSSALGESS